MRRKIIAMTYPELIPTMVMEYAYRIGEAPKYYPWRALLRGIESLPEKKKDSVLVYSLPYLGRAYRYSDTEIPLSKHWTTHFMDSYCSKSPEDRVNFLTNATAHWSYYDKHCATDMILVFRQNEFKTQGQTYCTLLRQIWTDDPFLSKLRQKNILSDARIHDLDFLGLEIPTRKAFGLPITEEIAL